jgi:chromosome segregation ATPase
LRDVSPLTDLDSEDEDFSTRLQEELRDRDHEVDEMRPELTAAELTPSTAENEADGNIRYAPPPAMYDPTKTLTQNIFVNQSFSDLDRPSSPISPTNRLLSRNHPGGVVRTQSGSIIPNLSKQPTPAPSLPDRDLDENEGNLGTPDFEMDIDTSDPFPSRPSHGRSVPEQQSKNQLITSLKMEIKNLQQQLLNAENAAAVPEERTAGKIAGVEKAMSQRLETAIAKRDATISALREENESLQVEVTDLRDSWRQDSDGLKAAESLIEELRVERDVGLSKVEVLEVSNGELVRRQADLQDALALAKGESSLAKGLNNSLRTQCDDLAVKMESLKRREAEGTSRNQSLLESLSRITNDVQVLRDQNASLELSVSKYRDEAQERDRIAQKLRNDANDKDVRIEYLSVQLQTLKQSAEESSVQKQSAIAALSEEILSTQENAKTLEEALATQLEELKTEKAQRGQLARQLADKERGLQAAQQATSEACLKIEKLTSELTLKQESIRQLSTEMEDARGHVMTAEGKLTESRERYEKERTVLVTQVSDLRASLETVKGQSDALLTDMRKHSQAVEERDNRLTELQHALEVERRGKSALEAGVVNFIGKIQDLEAQLADAENAKALEQRRIFDLQKSFANLRKSQEKLFEEFEGGVSLHRPQCINPSDSTPSIMFQIIPPQPSSEQRIAAPPL